MGYLGGFIASLYTEDYKLMKNSLTDLVAEPYRSEAIPLYTEAMNIIAKNKGLGGGISGSGPSLFALSNDEYIAERIGQEWQQLYIEIGCQVYVSKINNYGPKIIESPENI